MITLCISLSLSVGLSPPTAYAAFPTPPAILSEAALYQPPLLAAPRPPQTTTHSPAHTLAYYPPHPHLYMNMNMNYTAYYPRLVPFISFICACRVSPASFFFLSFFRSLSSLTGTFSLQPTSFSFHSELLCCSTRSNGSSSRIPAPPCCSCCLSCAASTWRPG